MLTTGTALPYELNVVYLPALWRNPIDARRLSTELKPWLLNEHARGAHIAAVGSGVSLLASTGLLDGRPATTHWYYLRQRRERRYRTS